MVAHQMDKNVLQSRPRLDPTIFHLETANEAHALLRSGATNGKLVVSITH